MKPLIYLLLLSIICFSCNQQNASNSKIAPPAIPEYSSLDLHADNSQTALDWAGTYFNVLPCASCEGIETWLTLHPDESFELKTNYLGLNDAREEIFTGKFTWDEAGASIQLHGLIGDTPGKYKVGENQIWHLDQEGRQIEGPLADRYILHKK